MRFAGEEVVDQSTPLVDADLIRPGHVSSPPRFGGAGASHSATVSVSIPATSPLDRYFVLACADDRKVVDEANEDNNCIATPSASVVVARPDLAVSSVTTNPPGPIRAPGATFSVTDDGVGFDPSRAGSGSGLRNLADRVESVGGSLWVDTEIGRGTTVAGRVPARALAGAAG